MRVARRSTCAAAIVALAAGCTVGAGSDRDERQAQPEGWDAELRLPEAVDLDPDPRVVEVAVTASIAPVSLVPGGPTGAWTYDGGVPGRLIRANVGDRVIVHFQNLLPEDTTIHWHGMRVPVAMDGAPGHSQPPVAPGEGFTYDFIAEDAALFWYHPHLRSAAQVGNGLYAPLLVEDPADPVDADSVVLVLSDMSTDAAGNLLDPNAGGDTGTLFGREGDLLLVNGRVRPTLTVRPGLLLRLRLVNAARSRYYQLALGGHRFRRIGGDGGLLEAPIDGDTVVLAPAERADVLLVPEGAPGAVLPVRWVAYDRGFGSTYNRPDEDVFYLKLVERASTTEPLTTTARALEPLDLAGATPVDVRFTQRLVDGKLVLGINDVPFAQAPPFRAALQETQVWTLRNEMDFSHPFHLHGFFFQVLDAGGAPVRPLEWKDTVDVPVGQERRVAVHYADRPGMWMFHCHILDHADAGMMGMVHLEAHPAASAHP